MKNHDWEKLYADTERFMKKIGANDFKIETNWKHERWGEPFVSVKLPKRNNTIALMRMDANMYCSRKKGERRNGKLYIAYLLRIEKINEEESQ